MPIRTSNEHHDTIITHNMETSFKNGNNCFDQLGKDINEHTATYREALDY